MQLAGKTALVTGAAGGIGLATAHALANEGANVALVDNLQGYDGARPVDADSLEVIRKEIEATGRQAIALAVDLTEPGALDSIVEETVRQLGSIDVLFNNAAITWQRDFFDVTEDDWDLMHRVNARAAFFCMQRVARQMVDQGNGGSITNISSIAAKGFRETSNAAYAASKGAVMAMSLTAAHALGEHSIRVNAICPGVTRTPMMLGVFAERSVEREVPFSELEAQLNEMIPLGRFNEAEDIAALAVFLAGSGRNITGQSINVDGGLIMH